MRRVGLVLGVAATMTVMMALGLGSALAKDANSGQRTYTDKITGGQKYNAIPPHLSATGEGIGQECVEGFSATFRFKLSEEVRCSSDVTIL